MGRERSLPSGRKADLAGRARSGRTGRRRGQADIDTIHPSPSGQGMLYPSILFVFGLAFMFAPGLFATRAEAYRLRRLQEIKQGGSEKYFEEQRDLLAYKPSQRFFRAIGIAVAAAATGVLIIRSGIAG